MHIGDLVNGMRFLIGGVSECNSGLVDYKLRTTCAHRQKNFSFNSVIKLHYQIRKILL